ncbi:MAG: hypothetical protein D6B25_04850 [Desulfobulbaceae bacterium]|nr:MAG: hypothetical protein D6B25_04850 [Desulfobulbaceae bacterium]
MKPPGSVNGFTILLLVLLGSVGCSQKVLVIPETQVSSGEVLPGVDGDQRAVRTELYNQFEKWRGTPYRSGGLSQEGVDCSGFVYLTFFECFGIRLARNTEALAITGSQVRAHSLRSGDLVFFRTGWHERHVGIYLEKDRFLHASTKWGVIISSISDYYWRDKFWQARRLLQ